MQEYRESVLLEELISHLQKWKAGFKKDLNLPAKQHHSLGTVDYWITQKALQNEHLEKRKNESEWAESFLPPSDDIAERRRVRFTPLAWRQPVDGENRRGTSAAWWDREPD